MSSSVLEALRRGAPEPVRRWAGRLWPAPPRVWGHRALTRRGVIEDLYYWAADEGCDTLLPLQNYFSVFHPDGDTATTGRVAVRDGGGRLLGEHPFRLPHAGVAPLRVSRILQGLGAAGRATWGTLCCHIDMPAAMAPLLPSGEPFYFWDRFYIGYLGAGGQPSFMHGVDKTFATNAGSGHRALFYGGRMRRAWLPELPLNLDACERAWVVLLNRTGRAAPLRLTVTDARDRSRHWDARIAPLGAHRFELSRAAIAPLGAHELRLRVDGMPTEWGRPVVIQEFANGAVTAMHC